MMNGTVDDSGFTATPVSDIPKIAAKCRQSFQSFKSKDVEFRKIQLRKLYWAVSDHETAFVEASQKDMGKPVFEVVQGEIVNLKNDILYVLQNLDSWVKDERATGIPLTLSVLNGKIRKEPLGCALIIGPFNYPLLCTLGPLVGAIAAGNTAVMKFSERVPRTAMVLRSMIEKSLDPDCYSVVQGAIPETQALLAEKWDKIFFTGSTTVGRIVSKAAAEHLTPVTLELGGRNPAIVTKTANIRLAARRLLWGKCMNAGQACISENYVLVDETVLPQLVEELKKVYAEYFPEGTSSASTSGMTRLLPGSLPRIKSLLDKSEGEIILGGNMDHATSYLAPTVILAKDASDSIITTETFAPIVTLLPYKDLESAMSTIASVDRTPLALYPFTSSSSELKQILGSTTSGGVTINDTIVHGGMSSLEFGGVGESGSGSYRGIAGFNCFTHRRVVVKTPGWMEGLLGGMRYPPYSAKQLSKYRLTSEGKPNFDREGNQKLGLILYLFSLGTGKVTVALGAIVAAVTAAVTGILRTTKRG